MTSFNDYVESRQAQIRRRQRVAAIVSAVCFLSSTVFAVAHFMTDNLRPLSQPAPTAQESVDSQLETQEKGYELVLQREPQNQVALEGLVQTRLKMKSFQGAQQPLEKLIKLHPNRSDYQALSEQIRQEMGDRK
jgi:cytochrome c-type biogenesis protein CcmH/NrfG